MSGLTREPPLRSLCSLRVSSRKVCTFQWPEVCTFRWPLTQGLFLSFPRHAARCTGRLGATPSIRQADRVQAPSRDRQRTGSHRERGQIQLCSAEARSARRPSHIVVDLEDLLSQRSWSTDEHTAQEKSEDAPTEPPFPVGSGLVDNTLGLCADAAGLPGNQRSR